MPHYVELPELPIRITAQGDWLHGDTPLHPRVATLFAAHVVPALGGRYYVVLGHARQVLAVDDTAYSVRSVQTSLGTPTDPEGLSAVQLLLSDGQQEPLQPQTLMQSADNVLYCRLQRHGMSVPCRFTPQQYHSLMLHAVPSAPGAQQTAAYCLQMGGFAYELAPYDRNVVPVL